MQTQYSMTAPSLRSVLWPSLAALLVTAPALAQTPGSAAAFPDQSAPAAAPAPTAPDALEQPYGPVEPPPVRPQTPAAALPPRVDADSRPGAVTLPDTRPQVPIRRRRRLALTGEVGWNGIAGFGAVLTYHAVPHVAFDLGGGLSLTGWKVGLRGRYNFLEGPVTPFIGVGFMATSGLGEVSGIHDDNNPNAQDITLQVRPSAWEQTVVGIDYTRRNGFTMIGAVGGAFVLNRNLEVVAGTPTPDERRAFDAIFRSSIVLTVATGYSF